MKISEALAKLGVDERCFSKPVVSLGGCGDCRREILADGCLIRYCERCSSLVRVLADRYKAP